MYSRADKSVGYATPAYMADHACDWDARRMELERNQDMAQSKYVKIWLVVWNMFIFPYIGNNHPN